jgi:SAM-dependent methyltransferase
MTKSPLDPFGRALRAYVSGDMAAALTIVREDGFRVDLPVAHFFRTAEQFSGIEGEALDRAQGRVLDVGAGTGLHALALQERGLRVTAIDACEDAVAIMREHGVVDARCADIFEFRDTPFDTVLLLGHGVGLAADLTGAERLLRSLRTLIAPGGRVLLDSVDIRRTEEPAHLVYQERLRADGRYVGEVRIHFEFRGGAGAERGWLHVDSDKLRGIAERVGWSCATLVAEDDGNYLAMLTTAHTPGRRRHG